MPNKKTYIIISVIIFVFGIVMFSFFGVHNIRQENLESVLIVGNNTAWVYKKQKWVYYRNNSSVDTLNWKKFVVYEDNNKLGNYYLWHDDKWYAFDENKNAVVINGKMIAYDANFQMKVLPFEEEKIEDYSYVYTVLQNNGLSVSSKFSSAYKVSVDYDGDSSLEDFYIISNAFPLDFEPDTTFSIAFMVKDNEIYELYQDVSSNQGLRACKPFYHTFIDTDDDGIYEIILSCGRYSASEQVDMLYHFVEGEFKILIYNQ